MIQDRDRPIYHYLPPEGLLWDPCAATFRNGRYHVFFLHSSWANGGPPRRSDGYIYKAWAHISSPDLVHWEPHPDAVERGQTGNLFLFNGAPTIIFPHPDGGGASCIATNPEADLEHWHFDPRAAVLRHAVQGNGLYPSSNDVTAWQEGEWCYALTGTRNQTHGGDAQHLFRSRNPLANNRRLGDTAAWEYVDRFYQSERRWTHANDDCGCPDFFALGSGDARKWMLLHYCHHQPHGSRYYLGRYEKRRFVPESFDRINWPGGNIHAPRALLDGQGRRILFVNLNEGRSQGACEASGWSGVLSLPVALSLAPDGNAVRFAPVAELQALRGDVRERAEVAIAADTEVPLPEVRGDCLEIELEIEPGAGAECGLKVRCAPDGSEQTRVSLAPDPPAIRIDFAQASLRDDLEYRPDLTAQSAPFAVQPGQPVTLRIFLDRSVLEVFAGDQRYLAQRIYPTRADALQVKLFSRGGAAVVRRLRAWQMGAAAATPTGN